MGDKPRADGGESRPVRTQTLIAIAIISTITLLGFVAPLLPGQLPDLLRAKLALAAAQWWGPLFGVALFAVLATLGAPQIVLITALVLVFGGWGGFAYSLAGKLLACAFGFGVGRRFGAQVLRRYRSETLARLMDQLARHGFWASGIVRLIPTAPSVIVNIAAGATPMGFGVFLAGTALGSVPKMAAVAFSGRAAVGALQDRSLGAWLWLGAAVLVWIVLAVVSRWLFQRWRAGGASLAK